MDVSRIQVIQACLDLFESPEYLEIGVWKGKTLFPARAARKVGVDPVFAFDVDTARATHKTTEFFEGTSDAYFARLDPTERFDVIYIDGLHTLEQTLRDFLNAVCFLKDQGVIVIDDVCPTSYHSSLANLRHAKIVKSAMRSEDRNWMGDVYKLTFFIESFMPQFSYRTISNNHGQLVLWRERRASVAERSLESVARAPFESIFVEEKSLLKGELSAILSEVALAYGLAPATAPAETSP